MNGNLVAKLFRDLRWTLPSYAIGVIGYCLAIIAVFPTVRENTQMFDDYVKQFPEAFVKAFGLQGSMSSFNGFVSVEFLTLVWVLIAGAFAISFGAAAIAKEVETGTLELLLSAPISRWRVLGSKILALAAGILVIVVSTIVAIWLGGALVQESIDIARFAAVGLLGLAFFLAIGGYSVLLSAVSSDRGRATILAVVITLLFYLVNFVSSYWSGMENLKYLSLFHYYQPQRLLDTGVMPWRDLAVFLGVAAVSLGAAGWVFRHRDITV